MRRVLALVLIFAFAVPVFAQERLRLKSGQMIEGEIIGQDDVAVKMDVAGISLTYWVDDVEYLEMADGTRVTPGAQASSDVISGDWSQASVPEVLSLPDEELQEPLGEPVFAEYTEVFDPKRGPLRIDIEEKVLEDGTRTYVARDPLFREKEDKAQRRGISTIAFSPGATVFPLAVIAIAALLSLAAYAYFAYCLQLVAQKTETPNGWFAWVPVMNFILICDIAEKRRYWAFSLLLFLIPPLGGLLGLGAMCFISWGMCLKRHKPGWLAICLSLPLIQFFAWGYLAFSE